jgi:hypothetical protein
MLLFVVILFVVILLIGVIFWTEKLSLTNDSLQLLEERLTKLEKDAVKVTFDEPSPFHRKPKTQSDYAREHTKEILLEERKIKSVKRKPKTTKDWEDEFDLGGNQ